MSNSAGETGGVVYRAAFLAVAGCLALGSLAVAPAAAAQSGTFQVELNGKQVGTASCNFVATLNGYNSTSLVRVTTKGLDYSLSKSEQLSPANELRHVMLSAVVNNEAVTVTGASSAGQILLEFSANGQKTKAKLQAHTGAIFMPDLDPGALETLLALAAERNNRGLWAIIPKHGGSIEPIVLATYADQQGLLNGKTVTVHHLVATITKSKMELFSGSNNQLLQAELPQEGFTLVRKGFVRKPPAHANAPSAEPVARR